MDDDERKRLKLTKKAADIAARAVEFDQKGEKNPAIQYYRDAIRFLMAAYDKDNCPENIRQKIKDYLDRADVLTAELNKNETTEINKSESSSHEKDLNMAAFLLGQALEQDENGEIDEALNLYNEATELCMLVKSITTDENQKEKIFKIASQAVERAETLKEKKNQMIEAAQPSAPADDGDPVTPIYPSLALTLKPPPERSDSDKYTPWELEVLAKTSTINSKKYVPFLSVDAHEKFGMIWAFEDFDGLLSLSPKQRSQFKEWVRPSDLVAEPTLIAKIDPLCIKQTCISDCSFISSLTVCAFYEKRFNRRLVTDIIYPKNQYTGAPVFNPCGKYTIKLHINGVPRKITLDDRLPIGKHNNLLCSYSQNKNEFWVSLLEKAYMKVMGGYDFPGSNSGVDLHALTGWIPDREPIRPNETTFNPDALFNKILDRYHKGDVLLTLATGEISPEREEETGLSSCHAYAVLNVVEVDGRRLFLLKNPWSHMRWKGKFSDRDLKSWTPQLQGKLKYDPKNAQQFDNGVFWIDYPSILATFDVFYLSWRPTIFQFTSSTHDMWNGGVGPVKALYNIGENPQYLLSVSQPGAAVWVLLTRHITDIEDFAHNKEYIALIVYKGGNKVYLPYDPPPIIDGDRTNSPHYLVKILLQADSETRYTLVVSQYNKSTTIYYTIRAYSTVPFTLTKITDPYRFTKEDKKGSWGPATAGGCSNHPLTYGKNPVYRFDIQSPYDNNQVLITLKGPKQYSIGFEVIPFALDRVVTTAFARRSSGSYRSGFTVLEMFDVPAGKYNLIPSTFLPGQEGPFFISVSCSHQIELCRVQT